MATKPAEAPPVDRVALYEKVIAFFPDVERKGKTMPYTSLNGNMSSFLDANGSMALRLGKEDRERFMEKHGSALHLAHGIMMKEYVTVPDELLRRPASLKAWFAASLTYVGSLKAKPTTRKPKKK